MQLTKNPRFIHEYEEFQNKINKLTDENLKNELSRLLLGLIDTVKKIDEHHQSFGIINPNNNLIETREKLTLLRKQLYARIKECENSGLIS